MTRLPDVEIAFFFAAMLQIDPDRRAIFVERVASMLDAIAPICEHGPGDVDRTVRGAFTSLWVPIPDTHGAASYRTSRALAASAPALERERRPNRRGYGHERGALSSNECNSSG
jgi:hypothetical protein